MRKWHEQSARESAPRQSKLRLERQKRDCKVLFGVAASSQLWPKRNMVCRWARDAGTRTAAPWRSRPLHQTPVNLLNVMGVEFKLTDRELPVSPVFINFLAQVLLKRPFDRELWAEQLSEALSFSDEDLNRRATEAAAVVMGNASGREQLARAYSLFFALLTGDLAPLHELQGRFHFINVIGIPRTGGSYLTAELYRALGIVPEHVPSALAHDSFPEAGPFQLQPGINSWILSLKTMAEYLTMVEIFFADQKQYSGKIVVPKKLTQSIYAGGFFHRVLGEGTEHVLTLRHPVAACVSTYEKSGGLPVNGCFIVRSNIEEWCRRDLQYSGCSAEQLKSMDYFDAYLRYWEQYHLSVVTTGLAATRGLLVVAYGESALQSIAQGYHDRYGSGLQAAEFHVSDKARRLHPDWMERARPSIERIAATWKALGIAFPADEIGVCW